MSERPLVYLLWHSYDFNGCEETKLIGVYASLRDAEAAQDRAQPQPGLIDRPDAFEIVAYPVGKDHWTEGYVTV